MNTSNTIASSKQEAYAMIWLLRAPGRYGGSSRQADFAVPNRKHGRRFQTDAALELRLLSPSSIGIFSTDIGGNFTIHDFLCHI